jgi:hypothetical protein
VTSGSPPVVGLALTSPPGVTIVSAADAPPRWSASVRNGTVTWRGGPIAPGSFDSFGFEARLPSTPGSVAFRARELYADGAAPPFTLTVVLFTRASAAQAADDGTRTLALFALVVAIVALLLAGAALAISLARWLRG